MNDAAEGAVVPTPAVKQRPSQSLEEKQRRSRNRTARKRRRLKKRLAIDERRAAKKSLTADGGSVASLAAGTHACGTVATAQGIIKADEAPPEHTRLEVAAAPAGGAQAEPAHGVRLSFPAALKKIEITDHGILLTVDAFPDDLEALAKYLDQDAAMSLELPDKNAPGVSE